MFGKGASATLQERRAAVPKTARELTNSMEDEVTSHSAARLAGVLFIIATVADLLGAAVRPDLTGGDYLTQVSAQGTRVAAGALLLLIAAFACVGIAISMYPILRKANVGLALGSVVFRTVEAVMYVIAVVSLLSLLTLGREMVGADAAERVSLGVVGGLLLGLREHAALAGVFAFCLGAFLYYTALFRARLIPRWLSGWGIAAIVSMSTAAVLALFNNVAVTGYAPLALPIFLQEMVLAVWLIAKGFGPSAVRARDLSATKTEPSANRDAKPAVA
jgi:hypothetical protein